MNTSQARKQLSIEVSYGIETVKSEYHEFEFDSAILDDMTEIFDDAEASCYREVYGSIDDTISTIDVSLCCEYLYDRIGEATAEEKDCEREKRIYDYLKKWKGFTITI